MIVNVKDKITKNASVFHFLSNLFLEAIIKIVELCDQLVLTHHYNFQVFLLTVFLVPFFMWLMKYLPKKFKLDETGEVLEHLD